MGIYAITGAPSGIGAAIGRQLKAQGHYVINISRRAAAEDAADVNISADLAMKAERGRVLEALYAAAPDGLDGFVSCSGVGPTQPADVIVSINYFAAREMTEGAYPLVEKKKGVILVVSSNSATLPQLNTELVDIMLNQNDEDAAVAYGKTLEGPAKYQAYQASKNAIARWVRRWSGSWAARGVRMNTIAPGATQTELMDQGVADPDFSANMINYPIPMLYNTGKFLPADDIAKVALFLLSPESVAICGAIIFADGGTDGFLRTEGL